LLAKNVIALRLAQFAGRLRLNLLRQLQYLDLLVKRLIQVVHPAEDVQLLKQPLLLTYLYIEIGSHEIGQLG